MENNTSEIKGKKLKVLEAKLKESLAEEDLFICEIELERAKNAIDKTEDEKQKSISALEVDREKRIQEVMKYKVAAEELERAYNTCLPCLFGNNLSMLIEMYRMALAARCVDYKNEEIMKSGQMTSEDPILIPVLKLADGSVVRDFNDVLNYIEDSYPTQGYSIMPIDAAQRGKMRLATTQAQEVIESCFSMMVVQSMEQAGAVEVSLKLSKLEETLTQFGSKPFAMATENPTYLDLYIYTHVERLRMLADTDYEWVYKATQIEDFPRIVRLLDAVKARPEFQGILAKKVNWAQWVSWHAKQPPEVKKLLFKQKSDLV
ncbi:hypothetical protein FGO68_gene1839 [Halteria grandinella]|uniref:GST C-terminal domain-containing protein n=1 Tax=Halteria grandinella TaxID=5974 RepID=A0A8J8NXI2_HALGN|nr:hypothetical protein FGO68_gene1839 [Halteria grandinella]